jgi:hypothetical protein
MTISSVSFNTLVVILGLGLSTACIITTSEDDGDDGTEEDDGPPPPTTGQPSDSTGSIPDGTTGDDSGDTTTGGPPGECSDNLVLDPGFEAGAEGGAWAQESILFDSVICDASCTTEEGASPYAGEWWVWFGGFDEPDTASVSQTITIAPEMAYLSFYFQVRSGAGTGDDVFTATLGGDTVFMATDLEVDDYDGYERIDIDVSAWADGGSYELVFSSSLTGAGVTSFFVDEVSLVSCTEAAGTGTGSTGPDTDAQDSSGGSTSDTGGTTEGSTGGSTGSTGSTGGTVG